MIFKFIEENWRESRNRGPGRELKVTTDSTNHQYDAFADTILVSKQDRCI